MSTNPGPTQQDPDREAALRRDWEHREQSIAALDLILGSTHGEDLRHRLTILAVPHWFNEQDTDAFDIPPVAELRDLGLLRDWRDGTYSVHELFRPILIDRCAEADRALLIQTSQSWARIFEERLGQAPPGADAPIVMEHIYHALIGDPQTGEDLLLRRGLLWKAEPFFAFDALRRLLAMVDEHRQRGLLSPVADAYAQLLSLFAHGRSAPPAQEIAALAPLAESGIGNDLFKAETALRRSLALLATGRTADALQSAEQAEALFGPTDIAGSAEAARAVGRIHLRTDRHAQAQESFRRSRGAFDQMHLPLSAANCLKSLAESYVTQGKLPEADTCLADALDRFVVGDAFLGNANTRIAYAHLLAFTGDFDAARTHVAIASDLYRRLDHPLGVANAQRCFGTLLCRMERYSEALDSLAAADLGYKAWGSEAGVANCAFWRAVALGRLGRTDEAAALVEIAGRTYRALGDRFGEASVKRELGVARAFHGQYSSGIELLREATAQFDAIESEVEVHLTRCMMGEMFLATDLTGTGLRLAIVEWARLAGLRFHEAGLPRLESRAATLAHVASTPSASLSRLRPWEVLS